MINYFIWSTAYCALSSILFIMQNPFLADRNIFSKVPNPIRKIADTKPVGNETIKAGLPDEGKANTNDYQYHSVNSPFAHNEQKSPLYKKQSTDSGDASNRQEVKITFG